MNADDLWFSLTVAFWGSGVALAFAAVMYWVDKDDDWPWGAS